MRADLAPGSVFAGYRVEGLVGRGGMGVVYRATDPGLDRPIALKLIAPELAEDERFRSRFLRESRLAAQLGHPHVLPVYSAGEEAGQLYLAMRCVDGEDLKSLLRREGKLQPERALHVCGQVAEALDAAHAKGLVHRDVKPANVLLDEQGEAYLTDFGLTKQLGGASTETGQLVGTLDYLASEQIRGEHVEGSTDEYALACLLYECLVGTAPFRRQTEAETLWAHMQEEPPSLRDYPALDPVFSKALAKSKEERYSTCGDLLAAAHVALGLEAPALGRRRRRRGLRLVLAGGALLLAAGIAITVVELTGGGSRVQVGPDSVGLIETNTSRIVGQIAVPGRPSLVAVEERAVWVASEAGRTLSAISPDTLSVTRVVAPNVAPSDLAADGRGGVWVLDGDRRVLVKIDSTYGTVTRRIKLPPAGFLPEAERETARVRIDARAEAVWMTDGSTRLLRLDPGTGAVRQAVDLRVPLTDVAVGPGAIWAVSGAAATLFRVSPQGTVTDRIPIVSRTGVTAPFPVAVAAGASAVWVLNGNTATVTRVDPEAGGVAATIPLGIGSKPSGIAVGEDSVWVANSGGGTVARIDAETNALRSIPVSGSPIGVAVARDHVWVTVQPGFRLKGGLVAAGSQAATGSSAGVPALPTSFCSPVFFGGGGRPDYLIASDLPFQSIDALSQTLQMSDAIRFVLAEHGFRAGRYSIGYQSCDDSSAQTGIWTPGTCRRNARAYAGQANLLGVIGTYNSGCSQVEIPVLAAAPGGPLATISPANTYVGLTHVGPGTEPDEPERYYPRGIHTFFRVVAADDVQGAADALLAKRLGISRLFLLDDGTSYGLGIAESVRTVAPKLGIEIVGLERWSARARSYTALARRIERSRADAVFLGGVIDLNGVGLVRGLRAVLGGRVRILAPDGFVPVPLLIQGAGPAAEGVLVSFPGVAPSRVAEAGRRFVTGFKRAVAGQVSPFSLATAQAAEVLLGAIARSDGTRASVIRELFKTRVEDGILGSFSFDRNGDTTAGAVTIFHVENGKVTIFAVITPPASLFR